MEATRYTNPPTNQTMSIRPSQSATGSLVATATTTASGTPNRPTQASILTGSVRGSGGGGGGT